MKHTQQHGIGLVEVMVALIILAIAILGFSAMQLRAVNASIEAGNTVHATNMARDLAERLRVNRTGLRNVIQVANGYTGSTTVPNCGTNTCNADQMATYDFAQVQARAEATGMTIAIRPCQGSRLARSCAYVAWGDTTPTNGTAAPHCTNGTTYIPNAQCIIMEIYNHG